MHPNPSFDWRDREAMLEFLADTSFTTICVALPSGLCMVHAPVVVIAPTRLRFHLSHRNVGAVAEAGTRVAFSSLGPHAYISPDWYGTDDQVPTWNYVQVEGTGTLRLLDEAELFDLLDRLSTVHEGKLSPKPAWTRAKMTPGRFDAMARAIIGFEMEIDRLSGTRKLGQNKTSAERASAAACLREAGDPIVADLMEGEA